MRLIKMFGLAALTAIVGMAFLGASSASAKEHTALCWKHEEPCANNPVHEFEMKAGTTVLTTNLATVLCLSSKVKAHTETLLSLLNAKKEILPLGVKLLELTWENCGTNAAHSNCTVTNLGELALFDVLKTELNLSIKSTTALGLKANEHVRVLVNCSGILHCIYGGPEVAGFTVEGALHQAGSGNGMFTAENLPVPRLEGFLCPATSTWNALYEPTKHMYVVS